MVAPWISGKAQLSIPFSVLSSSEQVLEPISSSVGLGLSHDIPFVLGKWNKESNGQKFCFVLGHLFVFVALLKSKSIIKSFTMAY